jgi:hypothetical protein
MHAQAQMFQNSRVLMFALQILLANYLKRIKTQPTTVSTKSQEINAVELQCVHSHRFP